MRRTKTITPDEHEEYLSLIDQIKIADAKRLQYLIELAELRQSSVDTVMDELGLRQLTYA